MEDRAEPQSWLPEGAAPAVADEEAPGQTAAQVDDTSADLGPVVDDASGDLDSVAFESNGSFVEEAPDVDAGADWAGSPSGSVDGEDGAEDEPGSAPVSGRISGSVFERDSASRARPATQPDDETGAEPDEAPAYTAGGAVYGAGAYASGESGYAPGGFGSGSGAGSGAGDSGYAPSGSGGAYRGYGPGNAYEDGYNSNMSPSTGGTSPVPPYPAQYSGMPPSPAPAPGPARRPGQNARRANLVVARLEPWSVMKFSFLMSLVAWVVLFVVVALLYWALSSIGVFTAIGKALQNVTASQGSAGVSIAQWTSASRVLGYTMLIGAVDIVLITALSTVGAMIYNLVTHLGGGIEVTLRETD